MNPTSAPNIRKNKYYVMFAIGFILMTVSRCFNIPSLETHTIGGVIASFAAIPLFYLCINGTLALAISAIRRNIKMHFLPILSWLFLVYGFVYFANSAWSAYSTWKIRQIISDEDLYLKLWGDKICEALSNTVSTNNYLNCTPACSNEPIRKTFYDLIKQGDAGAQFKLGLCYSQGNYFSQDFGKAIEWYSKAAEQGHATAQYNLGIMYDYGFGTTQDLEIAFTWFHKAALQGLADAQYQLGIKYSADNECVTQDFMAAFEWFTMAAQQGHAKAQFSLGFMYNNGQGITKDNKMALEWYKKAAEQGVAEAHYNLGIMYANGEGVEQNDIQACAHLIIASEFGHPSAPAIECLRKDGVTDVIFNDSQRLANEWMTEFLERAKTE